MWMFMFHKSSGWLRLWRQREEVSKSWIYYLFHFLLNLKKHFSCWRFNAPPLPVYVMLVSKKHSQSPTCNCICISGRCFLVCNQGAAMIFLYSYLQEIKIPSGSGGLSTLKSDRRAAVSALPFEVCFIHLAQGGVQMFWAACKYLQRWKC